MSEITTTIDVAKQLTEYIVLRADGAATWREETKRVGAANADAAIKKVAGDEPGVYVAVPARSWTPRTLAVKTEKRTVLS